LLVAAIVGWPLLPAAKSATGVTVVVTGGLVLLITFVSRVGEPTVAVLVSVPLAGAVTVTVRLLVWPAIKFPSGQLTTPLLLTPPGALTNVTPAGKLSVTTTLLAVDGPKFVTKIL
jgi:hypothetical protein